MAQGSPVTTPTGHNDTIITDEDGKFPTTLCSVAEQRSVSVCSSGDTLNTTYLTIGLLFSASICWGVERDTVSP